jgi:NAD(P)-dependent dehydrogenase (short-subunit alcohol dehydrogenase family)
MTDKKTILVTGATDGIGRQVALELARQGHQLLLHGRSQDRGEQVLDEIRRETGNTAMSFYLADFTSLEQVCRMADDIIRDHHHLDVLINNAGGFFHEYISTGNGTEMTMLVNHYAQLLLTLRLLPILKASAPARIVVVASSAHVGIKELDFDNLIDRQEYDGINAYSISKLANIMATYDLADQLAGSGVTVNCLHPGAIDTKLMRESFKLEGASLEQGSQTPVYLATSPEVEGISGKYFSRMQERQSSPLSYDQDARKRMWEISKKAIAPFL